MIPVETTPRRLLLGSLAALGAAFCYGSTALVARKIVSDYSPAIVGTAFSMMFGTIIMAGLFHRHALQDAPHAPRKAWLFVGLAGCASAWGVSFWYLALGRAPVVLVAPLAGTNPLFAIALTALLLRQVERVTWRVSVGALIVVGGVALIAQGTG